LFRPRSAQLQIASFSLDGHQRIYASTSRSVKSGTEISEAHFIAIRRSCDSHRLIYAHRPDHRSPITDNEHGEFGGLIADQNGNPVMAVFGTIELFVLLFDPQTLLRLRTVVINGSSFANGMALLKLYLRLRTIALLTSQQSLRMIN
jgi:hypothetical protein